MKNLKTLKAELLASAETHAAYDAQADEFAVARELIAARTKAGLTQADVAERMGTTQWAAAGFTDTLLRWKMKPEVVHGEKKDIQPRVQA